MWSTDGCNKRPNKQEIIKYSKQDDPETKRLQEAEEKMQQLLTRINMQKRMVDTSAKVLDLQERLTNKHGPVPALISPARRFVRHGNVTEVDLFTKRVVCSCCSTPRTRNSSSKNKCVATQQQKELQYILCSDMLVRVSKKVGNTQLEVQTMTHLNSVGILSVDETCL